MGKQEKNVWRQVGSEGTTLRIKPESHRTHLQNKINPGNKVIEVPTDKTNYGPLVSSLKTMEEDLKAEE